MKLLSATALLALAFSSAALATPGRMIATSGTRLTLPVGWHASTSKDTACDPERLLAVSSAPIRFRSAGHLAAPARGQVLVLLMEDRYVRDQPVRDLRRPKRFFVTWNHLRHLDGGTGCGLPAVPAYWRYFKTHSRYLGFIVIPGARTSHTTRAKTLAAMDSLRVRR